MLTPLLFVRALARFSLSCGFFCFWGLLIRLICRLIIMDNEIEKEIQKKGLIAPRITPERLEAVISSEQYHVFDGTTFTACLLTLVNGYTVIGESAWASPENFNAEIGRKIARENAKNKIWSLEGYRLKYQLFEASL